MVEVLAMIMVGSSLNHKNDGFESFSHKYLLRVIAVEMVDSYLWLVRIFATEVIDSSLGCESDSFEYLLLKCLVQDRVVRNLGLYNTSCWLESWLYK